MPNAADKLVGTPPASLHASLRHVERVDRRRDVPARRAFNAFMRGHGGIRKTTIRYLESHTGSRDVPSRRSYNRHAGSHR